MELGAQVYIDSSAEDPGEALQKLGGAAAVIATTGASMSPLLAGLAPRGRMVVLGVTPDPISVQTVPLIFGTRSIGGSLTGSSIENEDNLAFTVARDVRPMIEVHAAGRGARGLRTHDGRRRPIRIVLDMGVTDLHDIGRRGGHGKPASSSSSVRC